MKVRIKTSIKEDIAYKTDGACAFDFRSSEDVSFAPREWKFIETGTVVETPKGYMLMIAPRSGTFKNYKLMLVNSIGIIDQDYSGDNDTIKFAYINMSDETIEVKTGDRIGQGVFVKIEKPEFEFVENMNNSDRGGFGTTGNK
ncbi:dUTPase [Candidatus Gracilibacteria bacterium]|nr:MAG: dUTPase [Candidatus Gracilibacteria bacterium]